MLKEKKEMDLDEEDQKICELLELDKHVIHALKMILRTERQFEKSNQKTIKGVINAALKQRSELYYKYNF